MTSFKRHRAVAGLSFILVALAFRPVAAEPTYPGESWQHIEAPQKLGWSPEKLQAARDYADTISTAAVMLVVDGRVLYEWGDVEKRLNCHSMRKSLLSALYGIHVRERRISLNKTLERLGIDDNEPSLTSEEKQARLIDLIKARSGIYHPALYETESMKAARPSRGSHAPGTFWYYNNWDFNVLGTVFERETKCNLFREFERRIADPIDMQDFEVKHCSYVTGPESVYPAYPFHMTARDLARFGLLFLREGKWRDQQVIPADWVTESTASYSDAGARGGYGYMWWVATDGKHLPGVTLPDGSYAARGAGGHCILVIPPLDTVIVHRVNTYFPKTRVTSTELGKFVGLILAAHEPAPAR